MQWWHKDHVPGEPLEGASNVDLLEKLTWWATSADRENDVRRAQHLQQLGAELARRAVARNTIRLIRARMELDDALNLMRKMLDLTASTPDQEQTKAHVRNFLDAHDGEAPG